MRVYVTGENMEKLDKIREYLNSQNDVKSGCAERCTKAAVYEMIFNDGIKKFKL